MVVSVVNKMKILNSDGKKMNSIFIIVIREQNISNTTI